MNGSTLVNITALFAGVAMVTTLTMRPNTTAPVIKAAGDSYSKVILATLGMR